MKAALIGYGYWGGIVRKYIDNSQIFDLVKIYSSKTGDDEIMTNDISVIAENKEIEAVFICTPIETHFQLCDMFLKANKHVFCEKPTVKNLQEFYRLKETAIRQQKILFTDYIYLVSPSIMKIKELLSSVGRILRVEGRINQFGKFYSDADVFEVLGVHLLSVMQFLFPDIPVERVKYFSDFQEELCLDGKIMIQYKNAFFAELYCSLVYPVKERSLVIWGESGILHFDMYRAVTVQHFEFGDKGMEVTDNSCMEWTFDETNNLKRIIDEFYYCIKTNDPCNMVLSERVLELLQER